MDFIPKRDGDLDKFEDTFITKYPAAAVGLGIAQDSITGTITILTNHRTSFSTMKLKAKLL